MGDPKRFRKKYKTPMHPWNAAAIETEKVLVKEYGLKNKREIYKMSSVLKKYKNLAKKLIAVKTAQGEKEKKQLIEKLQKWGLVKTGGGLDEVLGLEMKDIMERRLQSRVYRKGLARTMKQARQFIVHRQVMAGDKKVTFPSYIVSQGEEEQIRFDPNSSLSRDEHPERTQAALAKEIKEEVEAIRKGGKKRKKKEEEGSKERREESKEEGGEEK